MKLKPLSDKIVVKFLEVEEKTKGGLILSSAAQEKQVVAEVLAVGPGKTVDGKTEKMTLKVGDKVILNKYAGTEIKYEDEDYTICSESEVLAIVE